MMCNNMTYIIFKYNVFEGNQFQCQINVFTLKNKYLPLACILTIYLIEL